MSGEGVKQMDKQQIAIVLLEVLQNHELRTEFNIDIEYVGQGTYNVIIWDADTIRNAAKDDDPILRPVYTQEES